MTLLTIDTATKVCSAALLQDDVVIAHRFHNEDVNHARLLPLFIEDLFAEARQRHLHIDAVALSDGPGSYTGLRIGCSTAKGICYALDIPLIPIHTTEVLCASLLKQHEVEKDAVLCPMIDARRMEVYTAMYTPTLQPLTDIHAEIVSDADTFFRHVSGKKIYCFGDGASKCSDVFAPAGGVCIVPAIEPDAAAMSAVALRHAEGAVRGKEIAYYEPFYLKDFVAAPSHVKGLE